MTYTPPSPVRMPTDPNVSFYSNSLRALLTNPTSFQTDPGYQFARDQAMQAVQRSNSRMLGSGNLMTALQDRAAGLASQQYGERVNQLSGLLGTADQYNLGLGRNAIGAQSAADQYQLGAGQNANMAQRNANDLALGFGGLGINSQRTANDYALGLLGAGNTATRNANDLTLGMGALGNAAQRNANDYGLGMYGAQTQRGNAESNSYYMGQGNALDWRKYYDTQFPRQNYGGSYPGGA